MQFRSATLPLAAHPMAMKAIASSEALGRHLLQSMSRLLWTLAFLSVLAGCAASGPLTIRGELVSGERIALASDSVGIVELARGEDGSVVSEVRLPLDGRQIPLPFVLTVPRVSLEDHGTYFARGSIALNGRTIWISDALEVRARSGTIEIGALSLKRYEPELFSSPLVCGDRSARVGAGRIGEREVLQLVVGGERFELYHTVTASGARYEAVSDPRTFVWFKGQRATLVVRGETYPECAVAN